MNVQVISNRFVSLMTMYAVLGLITSKTGELENKDTIKKIKEAEQYVNIDHICISPQCGFASTEEECSN